MTYKAIAFYRDSVSSALANYDLIVGTEEEAQFQAGIQLNRINKVSARLTPNYTDGFLFLKLERGLGGWDYWKHMHGDERQIDFSSVEANLESKKGRYKWRCSVSVPFFDLNVVCVSANR